MLKSRILGENPCNVDKIFRKLKQFGHHARQASGVTAILGSIYFDGAGDDGEGGGLGLLLIWIAAWVVLFVIASGAVGAWVARRRLSPGRVSKNGSTRR